MTTSRERNYSNAKIYAKFAISCLTADRDNFLARELRATYDVMHCDVRVLQMK